MTHLLKCTVHLDPWAAASRSQWEPLQGVSDLGRLWTAVGREHWLCLQNTEQAPPLFCYRELNSCSHSSRVLVPLQVGSRFHLCILTSLCNARLLVMLYKQPSLPEQWFPRALTQSFCRGSVSSQQTVLYPLTNGSSKRIVNLCGFVSLCYFCCLKYPLEGQPTFIEPWPLARWHP